MDGPLYTCDLACREHYQKSCPNCNFLFVIQGNPIADALNVPLAIGQKLLHKTSFKHHSGDVAMQCLDLRPLSMGPSSTCHMRRMVLQCHTALTSLPRLIWQGHGASYYPHPLNILLAATTATTFTTQAPSTTAAPATTAQGTYKPLSCHSLTVCLLTHISNSVAAHQRCLCQRNIGIPSDLCKFCDCSFTKAL